MNKISGKIVVDDHLFDLAFAYKQEKLWKKLWDTQLFAIRDGEGQIDYCCIMGRGGEHCGLAVYPGQSGIDSYRLILENPIYYMDDFDARESMLSQDCIMLSLESKEFLNPRNLKAVQAYCKEKGKVLRGKNAYPGFERYRPGIHPWCLTEESDAKIMKLALEAALEIAKRMKTEKPNSMGFIESVAPGKKIPLLIKNDDNQFEWHQTVLPAGIEKVTPKAVLDDVSAVRLKKKRKNHAPWGVHLFMHSEPTQDGEMADDGMPVEAPFYPYLLMIVDEKRGIILNCGIGKKAGIDVKTLSKALIATIENYGRPDILYCINKRTEDFLSDFCKKLGVKILFREEDECLEEMLYQFSSTFNRDDVPYDDEEVFDEITMILSSPELIRKFPDAILVSTKPCLSDFPIHIQTVIRNELYRRDLL